MALIRILFLLLPLILAPSLARATLLTVHDGATRYDLAGYVEMFEDKDNRLTIKDMLADAATFQPTTSGDDLNLGFRNSTLWLKLVLQPPPGGSREHWLLELGFPTLDAVTFYRVLPGGDYLALETGDRQIFSSRRIAHRNFIFPADLGSATSAADGPQTFYLRIRSQGSLTLPLTLWNSQALTQYTEITYAGLALYFGAFLAMAIYNLMLFVSLRDRVFLIYVAFVACMAIGLSSQYGLAFQFFWPNWPALANAAYPGGFALAGLFGVLFTRHFLDTTTHLPRFNLLLDGIAALFALSATLTFLHYQWASMLVSLTAIIFCPLALGAGIWFVRRKQFGARFYLAAWTLLLIFTASMALRNMGWLPSNFITLNGMQIGSALEMMLLALALAHRYNKLRQEKEQAQQDVLRSQQETVNALQQSEALLEQRVAERTAALEKANQQLQENQKLLREMAHHDPLTGLANRLLLDIRLEHAMQVARRHGSTIAVLLLDLDGFKPVNDTYGHAAGDELLIEMAQRMLAIVRQTDTVARLGGDEFILLLEAVASQEAVMSIAEKLVAALGAPMQTRSGVTLQVGVSVGATLMAPTDSNRELLIHRADQAMYEAKAAGGHQACFRAG